MPAPTNPAIPSEADGGLRDRVILAVGVGNWNRMNERNRQKLLALLHQELAVRERETHYDPNRLGTYIFVGDSERLKTLDDLYWSYVMEFTSDYNASRPFTKDATPEAELTYIKRNMEIASFSKVGLHKMLARADQRAKERLAQLSHKEDGHGL